MAAPRRLAHPSDEALFAVANEDGPGASRSVRKHVQTCETCGERIVELRRVPLLLHEAGEREERPERDLVRGAVRRLAFRRTQITNMNEFFGALRAILRGFTTLLSAEEPPFAQPRPSAKGPGEEPSRG